jgi:3-oxoacyl-[acyl-carrier protein] reductase
MSLPIDLTGRIALVTGGSGELGRVICRTLALAGADVAVHYHANRERAESLAEELRGLGRRACCVRADVGVEAEVHAMRDAVTAELGAPEIVVCNAVHQYAWTSVLNQPLADFESQWRTCVAQAVLMAQAFIPGMIPGRRGRFIAMNTECSMLCTPNQGAYVSGKRGMDAVMRVLAREVGEHQITCNQVAPGWMISEKYRGTPDEAQTGYAAGVALKRRGYDQDIANAVAFLASDLANFITGCYLPVCGGHVMPAI